MPGLLLVLAHPDDESMGTGGLILRHTRPGIEVHLICSTRGEKGWAGKPSGARKEDLPGIRTAELEAAAAALALSSVELWDYPDGGAAGWNQDEITEKIRTYAEQQRPAAVVTWGPDGGYGHPDHIAIGRCTDAAVAAIDEGVRPALYHLAVDAQLAAFYREALQLNGQAGGALPVVLTERVDVVLELSPEEVQMKLRAIDCHQSQLETWRVEIRNHPRLLQEGYGHEPYVAVRSSAPQLTAEGLLGEFA
ncbi:MAG TPA: PIG-L family deacetylase [Candidatus Dormibacteraeota bacterium]